MGAAASAAKYSKAQLTDLLATAYEGDEALTISEIAGKIHAKEAKPVPEEADDDPENAWKSVVLDAPLSRDDRAQALRGIFDSLDDGDHSISRREYVRALIARGIAPDVAHAQFSEMDEMGTHRLTVAKYDHFVMKRTITKVRDIFFEIDSKDGRKDRQLAKRDVMQFFLQNGLSRDQARSLWTTLDANNNGKIQFLEWKKWASSRLAAIVVEEEAVKAAGAA